MGSPPGDMTPQGAFVELQGTEDYAGERVDLAPLDVGILSLPEEGFQPQPLRDFLEVPEAAISQQVSNLVLPKEAAARRLEELGLKKPYSDPSLRSRRKRQALVKALDRAGLLEFSLEDGVRVGIFTVWKKGRKKQRVIVDARLSNAHFEEPESVSLPSAQKHAC